MEDTINIVEYDQSWTEAFESERSAAETWSEAVAIEHVGVPRFPGRHPSR